MAGSSSTVGYQQDVRHKELAGLNHQHNRLVYPAWAASATIFTWLNAIICQKTSSSYTTLHFYTNTN
jgi:hypothetical protein